MILGIDASNLGVGGGLTHLAALLQAAQPRVHGFDQVIVWGSASTLRRLEHRPWLLKVHEQILDKLLPFRLYWKHFMLDPLACKAKCNVLFIPGGSYGGSFRPFVTMSQNLLPFMWTEARRYGISWLLLKMILLHYAQSDTFMSANGLIFLTRYAQQIVMKTIGWKRNLTTIIPHGVDDRFYLAPRLQKYLGDYSVQNPFRILYVSCVDMYKHQWHVAEAVAQLRTEGFPVQLDLVGPAYSPALKRLSRVLYSRDSSETFLRYHGSVPYLELSRWYHQTDLFVFASSCENMPIILLEAMSAGVPIACSNRVSMPEILGDAGIYFDPEKPTEIEVAIRKLIEDPALRADKADLAYGRARTYTWERCARDTFDFIARVARECRMVSESEKGVSDRRN